MNSTQQGFLCSTTEHRMFDDYSIAINPRVRSHLSVDITTVTQGHISLSQYTTQFVLYANLL